MTTTLTETELRGRAKILGLYGVLANWDEVAQLDWLPTLIDLEDNERQRRSLERRIVVNVPTTATAWIADLSGRQSGNSLTISRCWQNVHNVSRAKSNIPT